MLEVLLAEAQGAVDPRRLERLDRVLIDLPVITGLAPPVVRAGNMVSARSWMALGEPGRALAALQRRGHNTEARVEPAASLRAECHLARELNRIELAARSCARYAALRPSPG